jgi:hypothetical protein
MPGWRENQRAGLEHMRQCAGIILRIRQRLRERHMACCIDELAEIVIGDRPALDPEAPHGDTMGRRLFGIVLVGAHAERAARNPDHTWIAGHI